MPTWTTQRRIHTWVLDLLGKNKQIDRNLIDFFCGVK